MRTSVISKTIIGSGKNKNESVIPDKLEYWNRRAQEFSEYAQSTGYSEQLVRLIRLRKNWTVLDMACGGGTIAIPLSKKVKSVTAVDFSDRMIEIVDMRCRNDGIANIRTIQGRWEDDWDMLGIDAHDVAIASRSLPGNNTRIAIEKLRRSSRRAVYITMPVGPGPVDREVFESTGRKFNIKKDYLHCYKLLHEMGIMANVAFIPERHCNNWASQEEAFNAQRWMFDKITESEEDKIRAYLKKYLIRFMGGWRLPYSRICYWAVMWWAENN